jgi:copper transport protein
VLTKLLGAAAIALGIAILVPSLAFGHADYDHSIPGEGETVTTAPTRVDAYFTAEVDSTGTNSLNVKDAGGADVDNNDLTIDSADATHMSITLKSGLANGTYTVEWGTTSAEDGEEDDGTFTFTVAASGATPAPGAPTTGFGPADAGSSLAMIWPLALVAAGALAVGGSLAARMSGRRA